MSNAYVSVRDAQSVLKAAGLYAGNVDGIDGPKTLAAVTSSEVGLKVDKRWSRARRLTAATQRELNKIGHNVGAVDGLVGPKTNAGLESFKSGSKAPQAEAQKPSLAGIVKPSFVVPRRRVQADMIKVYGQPGDANKKNTSGKVELPFPFIIAWDKGQRVSRFSCHEKAAPVFQSIFNNAAAHYGEDKYRSLGLDLFGGCYNGRMMRGSGTQWSTHAWGIAVDLDPENNQLKWTRAKARFSRQEYDAFWNIVEAHGCVSLGRQRDYDWMHFQLARED